MSNLWFVSLGGQVREHDITLGNEVTGPYLSIVSACRVAGVAEGGDRRGEEVVGY